MGILDKFKKRKKDSVVPARDEKASIFDIKKIVAQKFSKKPILAEKKEIKDKITKTEQKKIKTGNAYKVLIRPIISEKAMIGEGSGNYTFEVSRGANKIEVKDSIAQIYGIVPKKVRMINMDGKNVRFGNKFGKRKDWKKAIVTLSKGQTINIHEGV